MTDEHEHNWNLEKTDTRAAEGGVTERGHTYIKKHEKISYWLCPCGATKKVNHGEP